MTTPEGAAAPTPTLPSGWRDRAWLLVAEHLVFDRRRLGWRLAIRTMIGLLLPFFLAQQLQMPVLVYMSIGAYLLAIGDSTDDGDHLQPVRLAAGAILGGLALASGVLAGGNLFFAVFGMMFWGALSGLMGIYGNAFATMALPVAWAYVELGLPSPNHSLPQAALLGALFALGGALILILTYLIRIGGPYRPLTDRASICFRELAGYIDRLDRKPVDGGEDVISPETRVRSAIAEARRVGGQIRSSQQSWSRVGQRQATLVEIADRLFVLATLWREWPRAARQGPAARFLLVAAARKIADVLCAEGKPEALRDLLPGLDGLAAADAASGEDAACRMARELARAIRIELGDAAPLQVVKTVPMESVLSRTLAPLAACFDRNSAVARHALRFAVVTAIAVVVYWFFPPPFGYWVPLTATVVLKPYAGMTLARTVQRIVGTTVGILLGLALMPLLTTPLALIAAVTFFFFWMMAVLPFNYSLAILFLSAGLIPFEHVLTPGLQADIGLMRISATGIGAVLALVGGHLLWPTFEHRSLPLLLRASLRSMAAYADRVLTAEAGAEAFDLAHRQAGLDTTNLQAAVQHSFSEFGSDEKALQRAAVAAAVLQRLFISLNAVVGVRPPVADAEFDAFRAWLVASLRALAAETTDPPSVAGNIAAQDMLRYEIDRMTSEIQMLNDILGRA